MKPFYLTTPLYYVNAKPHIGHAYTTVVADCLARAHRQRGEEVFLLTGTDEHGEKISQTAAAEGISPKEFADRTSGTFRSLWQKLNISYNHFIRTTDPEHMAIVQKVLEALKPQLEPGLHTFWYCIPCETHFGLNEMDTARPVCPQCARPVSQVEEKGYYLRLEKHRDWLKKHIQGHPDFIRPESRRNEVLGMLTNELPDLCVTRPKERVPWGIPVPFSPDHTTYVWFDALLNYITALGWPGGERFRKYWEGAGAAHLVGKDIIRHHCLYWPIILHALGIQPPKMVFAHGWWLVKGEKMSKSKGNIVDPQAVVEAYGLDAFRYFLLRDVPFGEDGVFSEEALTQRINSDLANDLGNLVYRTLAMLEKHTGGKIPVGQMNTTFLVQLELRTDEMVWTNLSKMSPNGALQALWVLITEANKAVEQNAPWILAKEGKRQELENFLYQLADAVRVIALLTWPFLPGTAESIWKQLGFATNLGAQQLPAALKEHIPTGQAIAKGQPLFPRLET